jgi:hypothetical protein
LEFSRVHLNARRNRASSLRTSDHDHAHSRTSIVCGTGPHVMTVCEFFWTSGRLLCGNQSSGVTLE